MRISFRMLFRLRLLLAWLFVLWSSLCFTQTKRINNVLAEIHRAKNEASRIDAIYKLSPHYQSVHRDTLDVYAAIASSIASRSANTVWKARAGLMMGLSYMRWGWTDSALAAVEPFETDTAPPDIAARDLYFNLRRLEAMCHGSKSNFKDALAILYKLISEAERYDDSSVLAKNLNTIASISIAREQYGEALKLLHRARLYGNEVDQLDAIYTNFAQAHYKLNNADSADYYAQRALQLSRSSENLNTLATALRVQSNISIAANRITEAETALREMIDIRNRTKDGMGVVDDNLLLVDFYLQTNQASKAIAVCEQGLRQGDIYGKDGETYTNNSNLRLLYYEALAKCYKATGNTALYRQTLENIIRTKDSFYQENSAKAIAELQVLYEVQKKETTIVQQKLDITRKNALFYGALLLTAISAIAALIIFRINRRKQMLRLNMMQEEEKRLAAAAVREAEEAERRRIAADLHDNLGAYAASIVSTVDLLKSSNEDSNQPIIEELGSNAQSIVSQLSDTIWVLKKDALALTAISDRLKSFSQRINKSYPAVTIDVVENIETDHLLPPSQSFHIFQIIKEAVTNALKHSACNLISISIDGADDWRIVITDNGTGMIGTVNRSEGGNGLTNMQQRAQDCGCTIEWQPNYPSGTSVILEAVVRP